MQSQLDIVNKAISQSQQLLSFAETGEWQQFNDLEAKRQRGLAKIQLQATSLTVQQQTQMQQKMTMLIELNQKLEIVCRQQRHEIVGELKKINQGSKAKKAYSE